MVREAHRTARQAPAEAFAPKQMLVKDELFSELLEHKDLSEGDFSPSAPSLRYLYFRRPTVSACLANFILVTISIGTSSCF